MIQLEEARQLAQELASNGCAAGAILSELYSGFDGMRFWEHTNQRHVSKIWAEGEDVYFPPQVLCILSTKPRR